jgi:peptidoglycan-associated lipoprotein
MKNFLLIAALSTFAVACKKKVVAEIPVEAPPMPAPRVAEPVPEPVQQITKNFARVQFEYDSANLTDQGRNALEANAAILAAHPSLSLEVQGHCDERGTTEYNLALGLRRAESVQKWLVNHNVPPSRLRTVSYGEERPVDGSHNEAAWAKNRRADISVQ